MSQPAVILVVDDESDLTASYRRLFRHRGHEVVAVGSCAAALVVLRERAPALLVSDVGLPDGDGLELVRVARMSHPPVPAIVITAHASPRGRQAALAAGAVAYLSKPVSMAALSSLVEETLARSSDERAKLDVPDQARQPDRHDAG